MNCTVFILECAIMMAIFGVLVFGLLLINPVTFVSDYPPEIQERYYNSQNKVSVKEKLTKIMIVKKVVALIIFAFVFAWMAHLAGARTFLEGLIVIYGYIIILAMFDTFFLDWILFANVKRIRLPGTDDMEKEYHQKWFHVKVLLPMIPVFAVGGIIISFLMVWLW